MALLQTLTDSFGGGSLNTSLWTDTSFNGGTVAVGGGALTCSPVANVGNTSANITSATTYDLTGSYGFVKITQVVSQNGATYFYVQTDSNNKFYFRILSGNLIANKVIAGVDTNLATTAYNSTTHAYLKIRESGGTIFWDYSTDSSSWTNLISLVNVLTITAMSVILEAYDFSADSAPGGAKYVNFNISPTIGSSFRTLLGVGNI